MKKFCLIFLMSSYVANGSLCKKRKAFEEEVWTSHIVLEVLNHFVIPSLAAIKVEEQWCRQPLEVGGYVWKPLWIGTSDDLKSIHALRQSCRAFKDQVDFYGKSQFCSPGSLALKSSEFDSVTKSFLSSNRDHPSGVVDCEGCQKSQILHSDYIGFLRFDGLYNETSFEQTLLSLHPFHVMNYLENHSKWLQKMPEQNFRELIEKIFKGMEDRLNECSPDIAASSMRHFFRAFMWSTTHSLLRNFYSHTPTESRSMNWFLLDNQSVLSYSAESYLGLRPYGMSGLTEFHELLKKFWASVIQKPTSSLHQLSIHRHMVVNPAIENDHNSMEHYVLQLQEIEVLLRYAEQNSKEMTPMYLQQTWFHLYRMSHTGACMNSSFEEDIRLPTLAVLMQVWKILRESLEIQMDLKKNIPLEY